MIKKNANYDFVLTVKTYKKDVLKIRKAKVNLAEEIRQLVQKISKQLDMVR